jgi:tyrosine-protein kinase Etk/Wzc
MAVPRRSAEERTLLEGAIHYLRVLARHRWLIIGVTFGATAIAVCFNLVSMRLPPDRSPLPDTYRAHSVLLIQQTGGNDLAATLMSALGAEQGAINASSGFDTGSLVLLVLRSRSILDQLIAEFDLTRRYRITRNTRARSREALLKNLSFEYARSAGAITIMFDDVDPVMARDVVNRIVALADQWFSQNRGYAKKQQMELLAQKISDVKAEIGRLENSLKDLQKRYGVLTAQDLGSSQAAAIADLRSQLILKEIEIRNYATFSIVNDPHLQQLNDERQNILDMIDQTQKAIPGTQASASATLSLPDVAQQFAALTLELDIQRRIYNTLSPQYEAAKLMTESAPVYQVLETAEAPDLKSGPQRSRIVLIVAVLAAVASAALSLLASAVRQLRAASESTAKSLVP